MALGDGNNYQAGTTAAASTARKVLASIAQFVGFNPPVYATLTTALTGSNNDLTYVAFQRGTGANSITVAYVVSGNSTPLTVSVSGNAITVNVATDGGGAATSTAAQVAAAVRASAAAKALVEVDNAAGNDGSGVVVAMSATLLSGGVGAVVGGSSNAPLPKQHPIYNTYN